MPNTFFKHISTLVIPLLIASPLFAQEVLKIGDTLPNLKLEDQYGNSYAIPADTQNVFVVADNEGNALATQLIESQEPGWLIKSKRVYLADIHKMPRLVARYIAIPKLRKKPYPILLGRDVSDLQAFPRKKACVTVIHAKRRKINGVIFACNHEELQAASSLTTKVDGSISAPG